MVNSMSLKSVYITTSDISEEDLGSTSNLDNSDDCQSSQFSFTMSDSGNKQSSENEKLALIKQIADSSNESGSDSVKNAVLNLEINKNNLMLFFETLVSFIINITPDKMLNFRKDFLFLIDKYTNDGIVKLLFFKQILNLNSI